MAVTYTTAAKVKLRIEDYDTSATDAQIESYINAAESTIDCVMMLTARGNKKDFTFTSAKHGIIEDTASAMAAFSLLTFQPTGQTGNISSARAGLMGSFLWAIFRRNLRMLADKRIQDYLKGL